MTTNDELIDCISATDAVFPPKNTIKIHERRVSLDTFLRGIPPSEGGPALSGSFRQGFFISGIATVTLTYTSIFIDGQQIINMTYHGESHPVTEEALRKALPANLAVWVQLPVHKDGDKNA